MWASRTELMTQSDETMTAGAEKQIDERTFEHLNALADGELDDVRAAQLHTQMQKEPELKEMYDRILSLKAGVKQLHEEEAETQILPMPKKPFLGMTKPTLPIAASIIALTFAASLLTQGSFNFTKNAEPDHALSWHQSLSKETFKETGQAGSLREASIKALGDVAVPDLTEAQLKLASYRVFDKSSDQRAVLHYRGPRNCKLTLWVGKEAKPLPRDTDPSMMSASWTINDLSYHIVALGMDKSRFDNISAYVKQAVTLNADTSKGTVLAQIAGSTQTAPCT
jgi:anti-sigma factor RsiW